MTVVAKVKENQGKLEQLQDSSHTLNTAVIHDEQANRKNKTRDRKQREENFGKISCTHWKKLPPHRSNSFRLDSSVHILPSATRSCSCADIDIAPFRLEPTKMTLEPCDGAQTFIWTQQHAAAPVPLLRNKESFNKGRSPKGARASTPCSENETKKRAWCNPKHAQYVTCTLGQGWKTEMTCGLRWIRS